MAVAPDSSFRKLVTNFDIARSPLLLRADVLGIKLLACPPRIRRITIAHRA
jgi:hypothetical protein